MSKRRVMAFYVLSKGTRINIYDMIYEEGTSYALAGLNDEEPTKCEILFDKFEGYSLHAVIPYFKVGNVEVQINRIKRVLGV